MQILLGAHETVIKINSKSISIEYIQHFISTHFTTRQIEDNFIFIPASHKNIYHRTFLLKWLYSLYTKKNKSLPELKKSLLQRHHKAIRIVTTKKIIHTLSYKIIDRKNIQVEISPANNNIAHKLKTFLQTKIIIMPTYLQITLNTPEEKELLFKFINTKDIIDVPHQHKYNKVEMDNFLSYHQEEKIKNLTPMQNAYLILGISEYDDIKTIKKRYKSLVKEYHPDNVYKKDAELVDTYTKKFQTILSAYETVFKKL